MTDTWIPRIHKLWMDRLLPKAGCYEGSLWGTCWASFLVMKEQIPGAFVEAGVGAGVHPAVMHYCMRYTGEFRPIWMFDSFDGIPKPTRRDVSPSGGRDATAFLGDEIVPDGVVESTGRAGVPLEDVRRNLRGWGASEQDLRFIPGWFHDTIPATNPGPLALLRVDADVYESTKVVMDALYPRVVSGGFVLAHDCDLPGVWGAICDVLGGPPEVESFGDTGPDPMHSVWWRKP